MIPVRNTQFTSQAEAVFVADENRREEKVEACLATVQLLISSDQQACGAAEPTSHDLKWALTQPLNPPPYECFLPACWPCWSQSFDQIYSFPDTTWFTHRVDEKASCADGEKCGLAVSSVCRCVCASAKALQGGTCPRASLAMCTQLCLLLPRAGPDICCCVLS